MKKLTDEQRSLVEENHNLIYWVAGLKNLNLEEWYGLLAEELCIAIQKHNPKKSKLSWYYKQRVDWRVASEYGKTKLKKYVPMDLFAEIDDFDSGVDDEDFDLFEIIPWIESLPESDSMIVKLRYHGYTLTEIANKLGCSREKIRMALMRLKEDYENHRQTDS